MYKVFCTHRHTRSRRNSWCDFKRGQSGLSDRTGGTRVAEADRKCVLQLCGLKIREKAQEKQSCSFFPKSSIHAHTRSYPGSTSLWNKQPTEQTALWAKLLTVAVIPVQEQQSLMRRRGSTWNAQTKRFCQQAASKRNELTHLDWVIGAGLKSLFSTNRLSLQRCNNV